MADVTINQQAQITPEQQAGAPGFSVRHSYDLWLLFSLALITPVLLLLPPWLALVRVPVGLAAVLFAPGYALQAALFPRRDDFDGIARVALSVGLSVGLIPLAALLLDVLPWGLHPWPIALLIASWAALATFVAALRRSLLRPQGDVYTPPAPAAYSWWRGLPPRLRLAYPWLGVALVALLGGTFVVLNTPAASSFLTEFYIRGAGGRAEGYPREAAAGQQLTVALGIVNRERAEQSYRVEVWAVDSGQAGRRERVGSAGPVRLAPGQAHEQAVSWAMPWPGDDQAVELYLFGGDDPEPYRRLTLWLNVSPGGG